MTARSTAFVLTRPQVMIPGLLAVLFFINGWMLPALLCALVAIMKSRYWFFDRDLDRRVQLLRARGRHGVGRMLSNGERTEMDSIVRYCEELRAVGCDEALTRETEERAWSLVRAAGLNDATIELRKFRHSLPPLSSADAGGPSLQDRLARELEMIRAAKKEADSASST